MRFPRWTLSACLVLACGAAVAGELTWQELVRRPELWPAQCTAKETMQFQRGATIRAGEKLSIIEIEADQVIVATADGRMNFAAGPGDVDVLEVARAEYAKLTPQQQALTMAQVLERKDLWPHRLKVRPAYELSDGRRIRSGDFVYFMDVKNGELVVAPDTFDLHFEIPPADTDLFVQAREYLAKGSPGRLVQELQGKLVDGQTGQPKPLDPDSPPRYFVLYAAARWCPYTQAFTPQLLKVYQEMKPKHPDFEVIYLPGEKSDAELKQYAKEMAFPWPVVEYSQKEKMAVIATLIGRSSTPEIEVVDRYGNLILDNYTLDREQVLAKFQELLD